jgi:hypothetical protein
MHSEPVDVIGLIDAVELTRVVFRECSAQRDSIDTVADSDLDGIQPSLELQISQDGRGFRLGLRFDIEIPGGRLAVEPVAEFVVTKQSSIVVTPELAVAYANEVGAMTLMPYARQAIADMSMRVFDHALQMGIVRRGQFHFDPPAADAGAVASA